MTYCTSLKVLDGTPAQYSVILEIDKDSWGNTPAAVAILSGFLSGVQTFGRVLGLSCLSGWDIQVLAVIGSDDIEFVFTPLHTVGIVAVAALLFPYIRWVLLALGITIIGYKVLDLSNNTVMHIEANAQREQDKLRVVCMQEQLATGKTTEEALKLCNILYPTHEGDNDIMNWVVLVGGAAALAWLVLRK